MSTRRGEDPSGVSSGEAEALLRKTFADELSGVRVVSALAAGQAGPSASPTDADGGQAEAPRAAPSSAACEQFQPGLGEFAAGAAELRLSCAADQLAQARCAFVQWCAQGAKVAQACSSQFRQDAEDVRLARDLITRNIDAAYLAHVFSSVLVGKFSSLCAVLAAAPPPDLGGKWGRHATRLHIYMYI